MDDTSPIIGPVRQWLGGLLPDSQRPGFDSLLGHLFSSYSRDVMQHMENQIDYSLTIISTTTCLRGKLVCTGSTEHQFYEAEGLYQAQFIVWRCNSPLPQVLTIQSVIGYFSCSLRLHFVSLPCLSIDCLILTLVFPFIYFAHRSLSSSPGFYDP